MMPVTALCGCLVLSDEVCSECGRCLSADCDCSETEQAVEAVVSALDAGGYRELARDVAVATDPCPEERLEAARAALRPVKP